MVKRPGQGTLFSIRHPAGSEGPGLVAQDSRKEGIALSVACQSDPGGGDEEGELNLVRSFDKSILILLKKSFLRNDENFFRSQMPYNQFSQHS